jgi:hypothetical protein
MEFGSAVEVSPERRAVFLICKLSGYLLASITKTEQEWNQWSYPFLLSIYQAQFGDVQGQEYFQKLDASFSPVIGKGVTLWIESINIHHEEEDSEYLIVRTAEQHLLNEFSTFNDDELDTHLKHFSQRFMQFIVEQQHNNDARVRTMARHLSRMLCGSAQTFSNLENAYFNQQKAESTDTMITYGEAFKQTAADVPRQSLLVPYRMWRVAFVAVGGGALVGVAGALAAPTIMASVMPLVSSATTFLQLSVTMETYLTYFGVVSYTTAASTAVTYSSSSSVISSFFAAYGAVVSGQTMMKRTDELGEFDLLPLHIPTEKDGNAGNRFALNTGDTTQAVGGPVYILVPGHMDKSVDLRALWGANGSILMMAEDEEQHEHVPATEAASAGGSFKSKDAAASTTATAVPTTNEAVNETPPPSIAHVVLEHEVHALKNHIVHRIQEEVEHTILPMLPQVSQLQSAVKHQVEELAETATHTAQDIAAEEDWEELKLRYQGWWRDLVSLGEEYVLQWETMLLTELNDTFYDLLYNELRAQIVGKIKSALISYAASALNPLRKSLSLPKLVLGKIKELDGSWVRAMDRARQAGHLLARTLYNMKNNIANDSKNASDPTPSMPTATASSSTHRPVTLIGYGMGARLIFHCLEHLHDIAQPHLHGEDVRGIVEHAILLGAPVSTSKHAWWKARKVVADRLVNGFARFDWMLALMYRVKAYELGVAGLYPVYLQDPPANTTSAGGDVERNTQAVPMVSHLREEDDDPNGDASNTVRVFDDHLPSGPMTEFSSSSTATADASTGSDGETMDTHEGNGSSQHNPLDFSKLPDFTALQDVENIDLTDIVSIHSDYPKLLYQILNMLKV